MKGYKLLDITDMHTFRKLSKFLSYEVFVILLSNNSPVFVILNFTITRCGVLV